MMKEYAIVKRWKDNPKDFQVLDYAETEAEANRYIKDLPKNNKRFTYEVMKYTFQE